MCTIKAVLFGTIRITRTRRFFWYYNICRFSTYLTTPTQYAKITTLVISAYTFLFRFLGYSSSPPEYELLHEATHLPALQRMK